jgi:hypothetical protein
LSDVYRITSLNGTNRKDCLQILTTTNIILGTHEYTSTVHTLPALWFSVFNTFTRFSLKRLPTDRQFYGFQISLTRFYTVQYNTLSHYHDIYTTYSEQAMCISQYLTSLSLPNSIYLSSNNNMHRAVKWLSHLRVYLDAAYIC